MAIGVRTWAGALATAVLLSACGGTPERTQASTSDYPSVIELQEGFDPEATFTFGYTSFPASWDPTESTSASDRIFFAPVYDNLFIEGIDGPEPGLATTYEPSEDGMSVTLQLREGLTFSDGTPWNAEAAKFNLDRNRAPESKIAGELQTITNVEIIDELTIKLDTTGAIGALQVSLTTRGGVMVSPAAAESGTLTASPVGIGPYVVDSISPGVEATYLPTPDYWDPAAQNFAKRVNKLIADDQARYNGLVSGELDGASINPDQAASAQEAGIQTVMKPSSLFVMLGVNASVAPFDNVEVRKALNMAIDREGIAQGLYDGHCTPQVQPFPEGGAAYNEEVGDGLDVYPYDPEAAKAILEAEGVTDLTIDTVAPNVTIYVKFAEIIQQNLADIGITVNINPLPAPEVVQNYMIDKKSPTISSVVTGLTDPDMIWGNFLAPTALHNPGDVEYPEMGEYAAEGAAAIDPAERNVGYSKLVDEWMENPPHLIPACMVHLAAAFGDDVSGVSQNTSGLPNVRYAAKAG